MPSSYYCELKDIADAFEKLLDVEYIYTLKSKSSETGTKEVHIRFLREHLYHLTGLHHFDDITKIKLFREHKRSTKDFFYDIKLGYLSTSDISTSKHYTLEKQKRLYYLLNLEHILDTNKRIFDFDNIIHSKNHDFKSKIQAEYLLKNIENVTDNIFVFLNRGTIETIYSTVSIISPGDDYSRGQREECMLIKKKFLKKNTTETLFIHPSYFRNHLELADTEQEYINKTPELKAILENKNDKIAVMDSVDQKFGEEWLKNIENVLAGKNPEYLIVQHMEMDHSANIQAFMEKYPSAKIAASKMAFTIMKNMFNTDYTDRQIIISEGFKIELGKHELNFISAPNVHWPEVMMTYESTEKILFSADAFGKFGANDIEDPEGWPCEARRYYFGIVGKFGANAQAVLKKAAALSIEKICPLHGPVLDSDIDTYLNYYNIWTNYDVESEGVFIAYTSVYGHTKQAAEKLAQILKDKGCPKVAIADLAREDTYESIEDAFRYGKLVLATTTYNGDVFPKMREFILHLSERNYQKRTIALIENGSWAPTAAKKMSDMLSSLKDVKILDNKVTIKIAVTQEVVIQLEALAEELLK